MREPDEGDDPFDLDLDKDEDLLTALLLWAEGEAPLDPPLRALLGGPTAAGRIPGLVAAAHASGLDAHSLYQALVLLCPPSPDSADPWRAIAQALQDSRSAELLFNLAVDLRTLVEDAAAAVPLLRNARVLDPRDVDTWLELGAALADSGAALDLLVTWAQSGAALDLAGSGTEDPAAWHHYGQVLLQAGALAQAEGALARAVEGYDAELRAAQDPEGVAPTRAEIAELHFWRGAAQALRGDREAALSDLALAVAGDARWRDEARREPDYLGLAGTTVWTAVLGEA